MSDEGCSDGDTLRLKEEVRGGYVMMETCLAWRIGRWEMVVEDAAMGTVIRWRVEGSCEWRKV